MCLSVWVKEHAWCIMYPGEAIITRTMYICICMTVCAGGHHVTSYGCSHGTYGLADVSTRCLKPVVVAHVPPSGHLCPRFITSLCLPGTCRLWPHSCPPHQLADFWRQRPGTGELSPLFFDQYKPATDLF